MACVGVPFSGSINHLRGFLERFDHFIVALRLLPALPFCGAFYPEVLNVLQTPAGLNPPLGSQGLTSNVVLTGADFVDGLTAMCFGYGITVSPVTSNLN
ncbi:MAG: hypothetical protein ACREOI_31295 [bacterium]